MSATVSILEPTTVETLTTNLYTITIADLTGGFNYTCSYNADTQTLTIVQTANPAIVTTYTDIVAIAVA